MRYRLQTLLIVLAFGPPLIAGAWLAYDWWRHPVLSYSSEGKGP